jgi:mannosyltransferase OCH1-like enzyme
MERIYETLEIPKIIWQTHEWEYDDLPINFKKASMTWQNLNPTWEYRYSSASKRAEQVEAFSSELYKFYPFMDKVTQADVWRYVIVYQNGGVYSDMDAMCITSLDSVIKDIPKEIDIFGPKVNDDNTIYNANFGAVKNSICLEKVLDSILKRYKEIDLLGIIKAAEAVGGLSLSEAIEFQLNYGIFWYSLVLRENIDKVWTKYDGFIHMSDIKEPDWHPDYKVNYYGEHKSYLKLVEEYGWSLT